MGWADQFRIGTSARLSFAALYALAIGSTVLAMGYEGGLVRWSGFVAACLLALTGLVNAGFALRSFSRITSALPAKVVAILAMICMVWGVHMAMLAILTDYFWTRPL